MNTRLVNRAADLICRTMQTHRTPAGIAAALDAAGMLQSPESATELASLRVMHEAGRRRRSRLARSVAELRARVAELEQQAAPVCPVCQNPGCCCRCFGKSPRPDCGHGQTKPDTTSPWERAVDGLNALVDAGIGFHVEPDGHISNSSGDEHIEWDRATERWRLVHDEDGEDAEPDHPEPCRWPASPDCSCAGPVPFALTPQATSALARPAVDKLRGILAPTRKAGA